MLSIEHAQNNVQQQQQGFRSCSGLVYLFDTGVAGAGGGWGVVKQSNHSSDWMKSHLAVLSLACFILHP